jgi:CubicO group peptidase (beta-lactamase class C family)
VTALPSAAAVLDSALAAGVYTAVSAEIGDARGPRWSYHTGRLARDSETLVDGDTVFDLASLTKVISTAVIALHLVEQRTLDLDRRVATLLPPWARPDRDTVTVRDLLTHSSGLPAWRDYFRRFAGLHSYVAAIAAEPLEYPPRTASVYSDLGFIVLGAVLEELGAAALDQQFDEWKVRAGIELPLTYCPPDRWRTRTAATEYDAWRGRLLQGDVHDENAAALGGVAPHAGLFGTAAAVGAAARWWMRQITSDPARLFVTRAGVAGSSRALGWDTMLPTSSCGTLMSPHAFGHTGFTGTTLWIDPAPGHYFVLLTNRVHMDRASERIQQVRREFHDAAYRDLASC